MYPNKIQPLICIRQSWNNCALDILWSFLGNGGVLPRDQAVSKLSDPNVLKVNWPSWWIPTCWDLCFAWRGPHVPHNSKDSNPEEATIEDLPLFLLPWCTCSPPISPRNAIHVHYKMKWVCSFIEHQME